MFDIEHLPPKLCKGLFYRCKINKFVNNKGEFVDTVRMCPLKSISCPGCSNCGWLIEELNESVRYIDACNILYPKLIHNAIYELIVTDEERDFETGVSESWTLLFQIQTKEKI